MQAAFQNVLTIQTLLPLGKRAAHWLRKHAHVTTWSVGAQIPRTQLHLQGGSVGTKETITKARA